MNSFRPSHPERAQAHARRRSPWLAFTALIALALAMGFSMPQARADAEAKVVYHADYADPRRFSAMLTSINNMVTHYQNNFIDYDVRIVFVSHGIRFITDNPLEGTPFAEDETLAEERDNLRGRLMSLVNMHGVRLELCDITRTAVQLAKEEMYEVVDYVPSGVVRIAQLQNEEGFAYLKIE
jgi:uncharacterized protein